jgi:hypothetical protein
LFFVTGMDRFELPTLNIQFDKIALAILDARSAAISPGAKNTEGIVGWISSAFCCVIHHPLKKSPKKNATTITLTQLIFLKVGGLRRAQKARPPNPPYDIVIFIH